MMDERQSTEGERRVASTKSRGERAVLISLVCCIVLLLAAMIVQESFFGSSLKTYSISIIMQSTEDRFLKGIEQAAVDYNVDIHIVSGYEGSDSGQQIQYLMREIENNVDAVVIEPVNSGEIEQFMDTLKTKPVVIAVNQSFSDKKYGVYVGVDNKEIGRTLGTMIADGGYAEGCVILCPREEKPYILERRDGLKEVFDENGIYYLVFYCDDNEIKAAIADMYKAILIAADEDMAVSLCRQAGEGQRVFAAGYRLGMRQYLESGQIEGLVTYSSYDAGYIAIRQAVEAIGNNQPEDVILEFFNVDRNNMYTKPYEQILFPIG